MYANNQFLTAFSHSLSDIAERCTDSATKEELSELVEKMLDQLQAQSVPKENKSVIKIVKGD